MSFSTVIVFSFPMIFSTSASYCFLYFLLPLPAPIFCRFYILRSLLVLEENCPDSETNPNPNPSQGLIFLRDSCLVAPNPKTNLKLDQNSNPNRGQFSSWGNFPHWEIVRIPLNNTDLYKIIISKTIILYRSV